jgi:hypothetical protein
VRVCLKDQVFATLSLLDVLNFALDQVRHVTLLLKEYEFTQRFPLEHLIKDRQVAVRLLFATVDHDLALDDLY